jgi:formylglycine-generating enzyme
MAGSRWFYVSAVALVGSAASAAGGCAALAGLEEEYYVLEGAGSSGTSGGAGAAGAHGDGGGASGGEGGTGGDGGGGGSVAECSADAATCSDNTPQRCVDGRWEDAERCPSAAPVCSRGACITPRSCDGLAETCGPRGNESCCATAEVPGGTFNRSNDSRYPAIVSGFLLDRFEVTVGRFRRFVEAYPDSKPASGAAAHPSIEGRGWNEAWNSNLPADAAALKAAVKCDSRYQTWTDVVGANERLPMNCLSWYEAFAFCAWDGGRLATEAEWNYAAAGGAEQRRYPWSDSASDDTIDTDRAVYDCAGDVSGSVSCEFSDIQAVGSRSSAGDGKWGQADLGGNMWEWVLDWYADPYPAGKCNNCANITSASDRVHRGGGWYFDASAQLSSDRAYHGPSTRSSFGGARCARTP